MTLAVLKSWVNQNSKVMLNHIVEGLIVTDSFGIIAFVSSRLAMITGYSSEPWIGKHLHEIPIFNLGFEAWEQRRSSYSEPIVIECQHHLGHVFRVLSDAVVIQTPEGEVLLWSFVELPTLKPVHSETDNVTGFVSHDDVRQINHIEHELILAKESAERANKAKSEFMARMSHELRTPLNAILGFAQLLEFESLTEEQSESVQHILKGGRHLHDLINEVLDISRIEAGKMVLSLEPIELFVFVEEANRLMHTLAHSDKVVIHSKIEEGLYVQADAQRLKQILINLISNAIKYNVPGGQVEIVALPVGDSTVKITIFDSGKGIPLEKMERLFVPFDRLGAEATRVEGSGLGLALTKYLIEAMQGSIKIQSQPGLGTSVEITLPRTPNPMVPTQELPTYKKKQLLSAGLQIACIEQDYQALVMLQQFVTPEYRVKYLTFNDVQQGLEYCQRTPPDLIFLDMDFPELTALDSLLQLQLDVRTAHVPVIAFGNMSLASYVRDLSRNGLVTFMAKPLQKEVLMRVLVTALKDTSLVVDSMF